jgi:hypothetical protein
MGPMHTRRILLNEKTKRSSSSASLYQRTHLLQGSEPCSTVRLAANWNRLAEAERDAIITAVKKQITAKKLRKPSKQVLG